jgi:F0F1-type ATP synthase alpha subunit
LAIDSMIPIRHGQLELVVRDRSPGNGALSLDMVIDQARTDKKGPASGDKKNRRFHSIYISIGPNIRQ